MVSENNANKFIRLAKNRLQKVQSTMLLIQNLSNQNFYTYSDTEIDELFDAYMDKGREIEKSFHTKGLVETSSLVSSFKFSTLPDPEDQKSLKFHELAEARMTRCLETANTLNNLSNRSNYAYNDKKITALFTAYEQIGIACRLSYQRDYIIDNLFNEE